MTVPDPDPCTCDDFMDLPMREPCGCCGLRGPCHIPCTTGRPYLSLAERTAHAEDLSRRARLAVELAHQYTQEHDPREER